MTDRGALAERTKYAAQAALNGLPFGPHDLVSIGITIATRALDLADSSIQRSFGVTTDQLRADGAAAYQLCRRTADCSSPHPRWMAPPMWSSTLKFRQPTAASMWGLTESLSPDG
jgi:hypothetical protein